MKVRSATAVRPYIAALAMGLILAFAGGTTAQADPLDTATEAAEIAKRSPALVEMDKILDQAGSFEEFLKRKDLQERYFTALQSYFGGEMGQASFDKVMGQLKDAAENVPGFSKELWNKRKVKPPFVLEYQASGRTPYSVRKEPWEAWLTKFEGEQAERAKPLLKIGDALIRRSGIQARIQAIEAKAKAYNIRLNSPEMRAELSKTFAPDKIDAEIKRLREVERRSLLASPEVQELVAYALHQRMTSSEQIRDALRSGNGENVLSTLSKIQEDYAAIFKEAGFEELKVPAILRDAAKEAVPNAQRLMRDPALFERATAEGFETFYEVHRPIHGVWRGILNGECVGGSCNYLKNTTAARHSVPVLHGTEIRYAEGHGKQPLKGFTEIVPIEHATDHKRYGSLLIGHPGFRKQVFVVDPEHPGEMQKTSLFDHWLETAPKFENGIVMSGVTSGDNAGVLDHIKGTLTYQAGDLVGKSAEFSHLSENKSLVAGITANSRSSFGYNEAGNLIIDAWLPGAGDLTQPKPIPLSSLADKLKSSDPKGKLAFLARTRGLDTGQKQKYFKSVRFLLDDPDKHVRREAALWVLTGRIESDKVPPIVSEWATSRELSVDALGKLVGVLKDSGTKDTQLLKTLAKDYPLVINTTHRDWLVEAAGLSPEDLREIARQTDFKALFGEWTNAALVPALAWYDKREIPDAAAGARSLRLGDFHSTDASRRVAGVQFFTSYRSSQGTEDLPLDDLHKLLEDGKPGQWLEMDSAILAYFTYRNGALPRDFVPLVARRLKDHTLRETALKLLVSNGRIAEGIADAADAHRAFIKDLKLGSDFQKNLRLSLLDPSLPAKEKLWAVNFLRQLKDLKLDSDLERTLTTLALAPKRTPLQEAALRALGRSEIINDALAPRYIELIYTHDGFGGWDRTGIDALFAKLPVIKDEWLAPILNYPAPYPYEAASITRHLLSRVQNKTSLVEAALLETSFNSMRTAMERQEAIPKLLKWMQSEDPLLRLRAYAGLVHVADYLKLANAGASAIVVEKMAGPLFELIAKRHPDSLNLAGVLMRLTELNPKLLQTYEAKFLALLAHPSPGVRVNALQSLKRMELGPDALKDLLLIGQRDLPRARLLLYQILLRKEFSTDPAVVRYALDAANYEKDKDAAEILYGVLQEITRKADFAKVDLMALESGFMKIGALSESLNRISKRMLQELGERLLAYRAANPIEVRHPAAMSATPAPCVGSKLDRLRQWIGECLRFGRKGGPCDPKSLPK